MVGACVCVGGGGGSGQGEGRELPLKGLTTYYHESI